MNSPLQNNFQIQIESLHLFEFQDFITKLFMFRYGAENYISPRDIKDKGADGIIRDRNILVACYGPKKINKNRYIEKIVGDFESYSDNWESQYKNWMFVTNNDIPEYAISKINSLKEDTIQIGIKNILQFIDELPNHQRRELGKYLNIDNTLFALDYLKEVIEDLLKDASFTKKNIVYKKQIYFPEKVRLNFKEADVESILIEFDSYFENGVFDEIESLLLGYEDEDFEKLKHRIMYDFDNYSESFKDRLRRLTDYYLIKYSSENDDDYLYYVRAVIIYFFEQCIIGKKTDKENDTTTSRN